MEAGALTRGEEWEMVSMRSGSNNKKMPRVTRWRKFEDDADEKRLKSGRFEVFKDEAEEWGKWNGMIGVIKAVLPKSWLAQIPISFFCVFVSTTS